MKLCIVNGPNLNLLGERETKIYGEKKLKNLENEWIKWAEINNIKLFIFQSNSEGAIIDFIHSKRNEVEGFIINPGALSHYSYSLRDCISGSNNCFIEVHISNIESRENFRKNSIITPVVSGKISGLGYKSYILALEYFLLNKNEKK